MIHQNLQQHQTHLLQHVSKCFTFSVSTPSCACTIIISKTKKNKNKINFKLCSLSSPCQLKQFEVSPHVTNFLLISTVFLVQWNLNGIKFTFRMISRHFCSTKTLTLTLSIFWTDQSEGKRCRQAIQPLLHQLMKYRTLNWGLTTTLATPCPTFFNKCMGSLTSPANHITLKMQETDRAYGLKSLSEKTWTSNHLQMSLQRQHILLSYLKIPVECWSGRGFEPETCRTAVWCSTN